MPPVQVTIPFPANLQSHSLVPSAVGPSESLAVPASQPLTNSSDPRFTTIQQLLDNGEVSQGQAQLRKLTQDPNRDVAAHAQFLLGQSMLSNGDDGGAQQAYRQYLGKYPSGPDAARAAFGLAELARQQGQRGDAETYFQQYLKTTSNHALDGYAESALAQIAQANGDQASMLQHLQRAVDAGIPLREELKAATTVGTAMQQDGRLNDAVDWYTKLATRPSDDPSTRGHYEFLQAQALQRAGRMNEAVALYQRLLEDGNGGVNTGAAIAALQTLGHPLADFDAGEAYLKAKQFDRATAFLGYYLDKNPDGPNAATARYDRGRALMGQQDFVDAAAQFDRFLVKHPNDSRLGSAALLEGQALQSAGSTSQAVAFLQAFAQQHPSDPSAPQALWNAVQYLKQDSSGSALQLEQALIARFPNSPFAPAAAFDVGWAAYENLDFAAARAAWQSVRDKWPTRPTSVPALLWLGKMAQRDGNTEEAQHDYDLAWNANPGDYYAFRAKELASSLNSSDGVQPAPPLTDSELAKERANLEAWLATWTHPDTDAAHRPYVGAPISRGSALNRIRELAAIGLEDDLQNEVKQAMSQYRNDGRSLYALADVLSQVGETSQSLAAAYQLLWISPAPNAYQAPVYLQRLVYPFPYRDLITKSAREHGVDPLLLVSLIRQESTFDTRAHSPANAIGLTQFVPATAYGVASRLGLSDFSLADLYQPSIAIKLGAAYLATNVKAFGGNPYFALAAYNAGSGNVRKWLSDNPRRDLDLLVEEIPFKETSDYVRNIYRFYQEYQFLYRSTLKG
jgi:soluble lytic murein transglycosylase-like protein/outer membrane protein assembly factor BamD (BamD/ComL family)